MTRRVRLLADLTPLRESPAFRRLWAGNTLSSVGGSLTTFAVALQVYRITRSPFAVGAIGIAQMIPLLTVGLLGGTVADATDRRRLVLICTAVQAVVSAAFAAQAFAGLSLVWLLYALTAAQATVQSVATPAKITYVPALLPPSQRPAGLMLNRLSFQVMLIAGPALAGLITATPGLGLRGCYALDVLTFTGALYAVARLPEMKPQPGAPRPGLRAAAEGVGFIGRTPVLAGAFAADLCATVFGLPVALFPAINAERFGGNPATLGLFMAAIGVGGLLSGALSGPALRTPRQGRAMLLAVAVWGAAFAGFAVAPWLWLTLACLALAGAADTFTVVFRGAIVQSVTPDELRGRVLAADYVVGFGGGQLGGLEAGALGSLTTPAISALSGGLVTVAAAVVIAVALPAFTRYHRPPDEEAAPQRDPDMSAAPG